jgi:cation diffusion facilitator family transporter
VEGKGGRRPPFSFSTAPGYGVRTVKKPVTQTVETIATWLGIVGNAILFTGKILVGFSFNSIAIISDSFNSLTDIIASTIVLISVRSSHREPDADHPFGHKRAQPLAGLIVAIFTGIVGFTIILQSVTRLINGEQIEKGLIPIVLLAAVMFIKLGMHLYVKAAALRARSTALMASATDHRNDVLISVAVIAGVAGSNLGYPVFDPVAAILVGVWIIQAGFSIGRANIKYLMGEAPPPELLERIREKARSVDGVLGLNDVFAHYVGTTVEIELHINVDRRITIEEAHGIGKKVQWAIEDMEEISRAFIHIDPLEAG